MRNMKKKHGCLLFVIVIAVFISAYKIIPMINAGHIHKMAGFTKQKISLVSGQNNLGLNPDNLHSKCAILVKLDDDSVIMQKQSDKKIYPASLTKMMTALLAIENIPDLDNKITLQPSIFKLLYNADASRAGFLPGEKVRAIDLLYGAMLPSGAECCVGLADHISGTEDNFAVQMNKKAEDLGMYSTHFKNSTGLQNKEHYTTVKDLSVLLIYALRNKTFKRIFTSSHYSTASTNKHPNGITFESTLFKHIKSMNVSAGKILGGKTGYTDEAGLCLASLAQVNGKDYVMVTAGAQGDNKSEQYNIDDALEVYGELS